MNGRDGSHGNDLRVWEMSQQVFSDFSCMFPECSLKCKSIRHLQGLSMQWSQPQLVYYKYKYKQDTTTNTCFHNISKCNLTFSGIFHDELCDYDNSALCAHVMSVLVWHFPLGHCVTPVRTGRTAPALFLALWVGIKAHHTYLTYYIHFTFETLSVHICKGL